MVKHKPMRLVAYIRVSTNMQADEGHSVEEQEARIRSYCSTYDHELVGAFSDPGASASTLKREGLQAALTEVLNGRAGGLIVTKLDRLTRSVKDLGQLIEEGAGSKYALVSVVDHLDTNTASGRLTLNILVSVSQWEREATGERTKAVLRYMKSQGQHLGAVPYGYRLVKVTRDKEGRRVGAHGHLVPVTEQQAVLLTMRERSAAGASLATIAAELNDNHIPASRGGRWTKMGVWRALKASAPQLAAVGWTQRHGHTPA